MNFMPKGAAMPKNLGADIAHAELAERLADQALAHEVDALRPAGRRLAG